METYLAVDIGASSGRHILGWVEEGRLCLEEIYRFENTLIRKNGRLCWDMERLAGEVLRGLERCRELGKIPSTMGIDTWAVDYVLLDEGGQPLGDTVAYRDSRTQGMDKLVEQRIPFQELYRRTDVFGVDLYAAGLGERIEGMAAELYAGPGAVRRTLHKYVSAR